MEEPLGSNPVGEYCLRFGLPSLNVAFLGVAQLNFAMMKSDCCEGAESTCNLSPHKCWEMLVRCYALTGSSLFRISLRSPYCKVSLCLLHP